MKRSIEVENCSIFYLSIHNRNNSMTKEELDNIIENNHFSALHSCSDDEIKNLIQEIYYDGMLNGYEIAIYRLQTLGGRMPIKCTTDYYEKYSKKIRTILDAIYDKK